MPNSWLGFVNWFNNSGQHPSFYRTTYMPLPNPDIQTAYLEWLVWLDVGTWEVVVQSADDPEAGKYTVSLGGVDIFTHDSYVSSSVASILFDVFDHGSIAIATPGMTALRLRTNGKNPASADYSLYITQVVCRRIA